MFNELLLSPLMKVDEEEGGLFGGMEDEEDFLVDMFSVPSVKEVAVSKPVEKRCKKRKRFKAKFAEPENNPSGPPGTALPTDVLRYDQLVPDAKYLSIERHPGDEVRTSSKQEKRYFPVHVSLKNITQFPVNVSVSLVFADDLSAADSSYLLGTLSKEVTRNELVKFKDLTIHATSSKNKERDFALKVEVEGYEDATVYSQAFLSYSNQSVLIRRRLELGITSVEHNNNLVHVYGTKLIMSKKFKIVCRYVDDNDEWVSVPLKILEYRKKKKCLVCEMPELEDDSLECFLQVSNDSKYFSKPHALHAFEHNTKKKIVRARL